MEIKELRIGNLVDTVYEPKKVRITSIRDGFVSANFSDKVIETISLKSINPIPLTEEILLKCGFEAKSIYDNFILNGIEIMSTIRIISTNERKSFYLDGNIPDFIKIKIESLHQLQNIYFALTGEELEINL